MRAGSHVLLLLSIGIGIILPYSVMAMGDHPTAPTAHDTEHYAAPEVEIISRRSSRPYFQHPTPKPTAVSVAPVELLPTVGSDAHIVANRVRIIDIQTALSHAGFDPGALDGKSGPRTKKAIRDFQKKNNLVVDGIVGPKTWEQLQVFLPAPQAPDHSDRR